MVDSNVKRMVVITESMYNRLISQKPDIPRPMTSLTEANSDFENLKRINSNMDILREQRTAQLANVNSITPNSIAGTITNTNTPNTTLNTSVEASVGEKQLFLEGA